MPSDSELAYELFKSLPPKERAAAGCVMLAVCDLGGGREPLGRLLAGEAHPRLTEPPAALREDAFRLLDNGLTPTTQERDVRFQWHSLKLTDLRELRAGQLRQLGGEMVSALSVSSSELE